MRSDDSEIHSALFSSLHESVTLVEEAEISHLDAAPIHLLTTASISWLQLILPNVGIDERRFRPNLLVDAHDFGAVESEWIGKRLRVGRSVELEVVSPTERCGMVALRQDGLEEEPGVLRSITQEANLG